MLNDSIRKELEHHNFIVFAMLYGSFAEGRATDISDIDIGLYTDTDISLLDIGFIVTRIEKISQKKVDILVLNDIYKKNPALSFEIISNGQLILCRNQDAFIDFKKNTLLFYFDTIPLRNIINRRFKTRLNENRLGERNYVGTP